MNAYVIRNTFIPRAVMYNIMMKDNHILLYVRTKRQIKIIISNLSYESHAQRRQFLYMVNISKPRSFTKELFVRFSVFFTK
jgi:hypothetical protein